MTALRPPGCGGFRTCNLNQVFFESQTEQRPLLDVFCFHAFVVVIVVVLFAVSVGDVLIASALLSCAYNERGKVFIVVFLPFI